MAKAYIYKGANGNSIFFASNIKRARFIAYKDLAGEESFNDMVVERIEELDYLDHVDGYVMKSSRASDRIQLQKAGLEI